MHMQYNRKHSYIHSHVYVFTIKLYIIISFLLDAQVLVHARLVLCLQPITFVLKISSPVVF